MSKTNKNNLFVQFWRSDKVLLSALFALCAFLISFTGFRILYIQQKIVFAIIILIALIALTGAVFYLIIKKCGGTSETARRVRDNKTVLLSLFITGALSLFIFAVYTLSPIGNYTVLKMDLYHQYGPLFAELYDKIKEGKSLLYSWNSGGGSGFLGNFFNYLSSPFTLLIFWFSKTEVVTTGISVIIFAKCTVSAGTFAYYLKNKSRDRSLSLSIAAFAVLYAFSAYFIAYYWNVMWLDAMLIFPLVILGIEKIIDSSNAKLYFISLIYTFLTNYYMAYMICIFSVVYFVVYYLSNYAFTALYVPKTRDMPRLSKIRQSRLLCAGFRFAGASLLAAVCCSAVLIPVYKVLSSSSATGDTFPAEADIYFDIYDFVAAHLASLEPTIRSSGGDVTPNIYCGIITILLYPLYLMNKRIGWKEKVLHTLLLFGIFVCCNINITNFVLHGFHYPNDLPYRFSFMYSFILLVCAYKVFRHIKDYNYKTMIFDTLHWDSIVNQNVKVLNTNIELEPYKEWSQIGHGIFWWSAYGELKHDMIANYTKGNLNVLLYSLAALYILELYVVKFIGDKTEDRDVPNDISKLFEICNWKTQDHVIAFETYEIRESEIEDMFKDLM